MEKKAFKIPTRFASTTTLNSFTISFSLLNVSEWNGYWILTCLEVYMISWPLMARIPCALCWGYILCLAIIKAYMLFMDPPGAKIESPFWNPMISRIFLKHSCSIRMKTGAISYVNMLVLLVAVNHSPAMDTTSKPVESWLKNRGCPAKIL